MTVRSLYLHADVCDLDLYLDGDAVADTTCDMRDAVVDEAYWNTTDSDGDPDLDTDNDEDTDWDDDDDDDSDWGDFDDDDDDRDDDDDDWEDDDDDGID